MEFESIKAIPYIQIWKKKYSKLEKKINLPP